MLKAALVGVGGISPTHIGPWKSMEDVDFMLYAFGMPKSHSVNRTKRPDQDYIQTMFLSASFEQLHITGIRLLINGTISSVSSL